MTDFHRWFFFWFGVVAVAGFAWLLEYVYPPPKPEPCADVPYELSDRPACMTVKTP